MIILDEARAIVQSGPCRIKLSTLEECFFFLFGDSRSATLYVGSCFGDLPPVDFSEGWAANWF